MAVPGFADMHNHQFAHLGFGGLEFFGAPSGPVDQALPWCTPVHGLGGTTDVIGSFMKWSTYGFHFNFGHKVGGYPAFDGWPRWDSYTHQTVHVDWLQRAWQGGMRLMVMLAVNNEWMCKLPGFKLAPGRTPADMEAVDLQLDAAVALEAQLDQQAGGPGQGWYRIVRSAEEAASVIEAGKLAVLLGIEVDYLFGSYIPDPLGLLTPDQVKASVQQYYDKGVRYVFPIHFADNAFGGTGLQNPMEAADTGVDFNTPIGDLHTPYILETVDGTNLGYAYSGLNTQGRVGRRNKRGLTGLGKVLIAGTHSTPDALRCRSHVLADTAPTCSTSPRPPITPSSPDTPDSSMCCLGDKRHEGQQTGAEVDRIRGTGGMVAPIIAQGNLAEIKTWMRPDGTSIRHVCGSTANSYLQAYLYAVERMNGGPVGIGTDFNGFAGVPGPITGPDACPGKTAPNTPPPAQLSYPFTAAVTGAQMQRSQIGQKTFDINTDGLAHVGMLPDFIAHLSAMGVREDELQPLLYSADGFVQTWKRTSPATPRIAVLSTNGSLSVKEGDLNAAWVQETGGPGGGDTASFQIDGNRIAVLSTNGSLSVKEGDLNAAWVQETNGGTKSFQVDGDRIAVLSTNGSLSVKEGDLNAAWVQETGGPGGGDTASFQIDGNRIAVLSTNGSLSVKEGDLNAAWVQETNGGTKSFQVDGDRIAVLSTNGSLSVKEGDLNAAWVQETGGPGGGDTASFQIDGNRIAVLSTNGSLSVKEGDLNAAWVQETNGGTKSFQVDGDRIAVLSTNGSLSVKEGDLNAAWVQETGGPGGGDTASFQIDGNRIAVLSTNGSLSVKEGDLNAAWVQETNGGTKSFQVES